MIPGHGGPGGGDPAARARAVPLPGVPGHGAAAS